MIGPGRGCARVAVLLLALGVDGPAAQTVDCSHFPVRDVLVNAPPNKGLNVLILGDGFQADELQTYRRAACLLVDGIVSEPPFSSFACRLNFYRIDSVSSYDDIPTNCATGYARTWTGAGATPCVSSSTGLPAGSVPPLDLNSEVCPSGDNSRIVWPDAAGEQTALELATVCAASKNIHVIILLADTATPAAAAQAGPSIPKLTVTTLASIENDGSRHHRIAHELGHTLSLLDEYQDDDLESSSYHCGRNVWSPCEDCDGDGAADTPFQASWAAYCEPWEPLSQTQEAMRCGPGLQASPCSIGLCASAAASCEPCGNPAPDLPDVGLYEGGFYEECGYFRAQRFCRMEDNIDRPFCVACLCVAKRFLEDGVGLAECSTPSVCATPDILIRDCPADDGTVPSPCPGVPASPDISFSLALDSANPSGLLLNTFVCAVNNGEAIEAGRLHAILRLEVSNPSGSQVQKRRISDEIQNLVPFPSETIPDPLTWLPGERRCLQTFARFHGLMPAAAAKVRAALWIRGDAPVPNATLRDDDNLAAKEQQPLPF
jgi:hypothetical protein